MTKEEFDVVLAAWRDRVRCAEKVLYAAENFIWEEDSIGSVQEAIDVYRSMYLGDK